MYLYVCIYMHACIYVCLYACIYEFVYNIVFRTLRMNYLEESNAYMRFGMTLLLCDCMMMAIPLKKKMGGWMEQLVSSFITMLEAVRRDSSSSYLQEFNTHDCDYTSKVLIYIHLIFDDSFLDVPSSSIYNFYTKYYSSFSLCSWLSSFDWWSCCLLGCDSWGCARWIPSRWWTCSWIGTRYAVSLQWWWGGCTLF